MNYALLIMICLWAFRLSPSGFPLYLSPLRSKRMPLQSLTHRGYLKSKSALKQKNRDAKSYVSILLIVNCPSFPQRCNLLLKNFDLRLGI